ncbi:MAG: hypothetical protein H7199_08360 [Burkholderiales bacterium]|nr:hypothetical protein [Flavobacterium sp.]
MFTYGIRILNNAFVLRYTDKPLPTLNTDNIIGLTALIFNQELLVPVSENILKIAVSDITGKLIHKKSK